MATLPKSDGWNQGNEEDLSVIHDCVCPNCGGGKAKSLILPTRVPLFREIYVASLDCEDCNFRNSEVNFGGKIQEKGEQIQLYVTCPADLNRQIIKSDSASLSIPKIEFEIPPGTQRGSISTIEGMIKRAAENLERQQQERLRLVDVANFHRCRSVIKQLRWYAGDVMLNSDEEGEDMTLGPFPFGIILDDPAGNSYIENPNAPSPDQNLVSTKYYRKPTQDMALGLQPSKTAVKDGAIDDLKESHKNIANAPKGSHYVGMEDNDSVSTLGRQEVIKFQGQCPNCYRETTTNMCVIGIPHFKEVIIMSLLCENCGYKSNEIKGGGAIPKYGTKITVHITNQEDLGREVLKSDSAGIIIPELDLELKQGGINGLYTSVEGLLNKMHESLTTANPFGSGDAAIKQHLTNDGNNDCYNTYKDKGMDIEEYERTHDQNEDFGLNDMKTENYHIETGGEEPTVKNYYGTDKMENLPDRIRQVDVRGPDHPHQVAKAPVTGDSTVMGAGSVKFAVPSMGQRGKQTVKK